MWCRNRSISIFSCFTSSNHRWTLLMSRGKEISLHLSYIEYGKESWLITWLPLLRSFHWVRSIPAWWLSRAWNCIHRLMDKWYKHCDKWQTSLWYIWPIHFWTFLVQTRPSMNQESRKHWINCFEKIPLTSYCTSKASKNDRCVISMRRIVLFFAYLSAFRAFAFYSDPVWLKKRHCTFKSIWFGNILKGSSVF